MIPLLALAAAAGTARAGLGMYQSNQEKQRQKGIIGKAYKLGRERMNLRQGDVRNSVAENLGQRGLTQGGDVRDPGVGSTPSLTTPVGGAHTLGGQQMADLAREQNLEAFGLKQERDRALSDTRAAASAGIVNSIASGIDTGVSVYGMGKDAGALSAMRSAPPAGIGQGVRVDAPPPGWTPTRYPGSYRGIDPINPVGRSTATADFNKYSGANVG